MAFQAACCWEGARRGPRCHPLHSRPTPISPSHTPNPRIPWPPPTSNPAPYGGPIPQPCRVAPISPAAIDKTPPPRVEGGAGALAVLAAAGSFHACPPSRWAATWAGQSQVGTDRHPPQDSDGKRCRRAGPPTRPAAATRTSRRHCCKSPPGPRDRSCPALPSTSVPTALPGLVLPLLSLHQVYMPTLKYRCQHFLCCADPCPLSFLSALLVVFLTNTPAPPSCCSLH